VPSGSTSDLDIEVWRLARAGVDDLVTRIRAEDWGCPTPCVEWDVHDLVNHLVGSNQRHVMLLRGGNEHDFWVTRATEDVLTDDPPADWKFSADALDAAFVERGAMDRTISYRLPTGRALLRGRVFDVTVHTWDLARAIGVDVTLDKRLVAACLASPLAATLAHGEGLPATDDHEQLAAPPRSPLADDASDQERLLWLCGRSHFG